MIFNQSHCSDEITSHHYHHVIFNQSYCSDEITSHHHHHVIFNQSYCSDEITWVTTTIMWSSTNHIAHTSHHYHHKFLLPLIMCLKWCVLISSKNLVSRSSRRVGVYFQCIYNHHVSHSLPSTPAVQLDLLGQWDQWHPTVVVWEKWLKKWNVKLHLQTHSHVHREKWPQVHIQNRKAKQTDCLSTD